MKNTFWLLPNAYSHETPSHSWVTPKLKEIVDRLTGIVAENEKEARVFLKAVKTDRVLQSYPIRLLNEHSDPKAVQDLIQEIKKSALEGGEWGLISDQGLPSLADPGENLVQLLRSQGIKIQALGAGSSIIHALLISGFPAESFKFIGYFPKEEHDLIACFKKIDKECREGLTQMAIERPYGNIRIIEQAQNHLPDNLKMAVVCDVGSDKEEITLLPIQKWKGLHDLTQFNKRPAIFLFSS